MATDDRQVLVTGQENAPAAFTVPGNGQIRPKAVFATFDGSGAAGDFKPALIIRSDAGELVGICAADDVVVAGESADVSWFPRVGDSGAIRFNVNNVGDWLDITVNGTVGLFRVTSEHGITLQDFGGGNVSLISLAGILLSALDDLSLSSAGTAELTATNGVDIVSNAALNILPFPVSFGVNSVQVAAGDATHHGIVVLEAFDNQATPAYSEYFVGYVDFNPNPYSYNGQTAQILGGQTFTVVGSDGSPIFQVKALEQGGTVHIKTGTTVHADL